MPAPPGRSRTLRIHALCRLVAAMASPVTPISEQAVVRADRWEWGDVEVQTVGTVA